MIGDVVTEMPLLSGKERIRSFACLTSRPKLLSLHAPTIFKISEEHFGDK